MRRGVLAVSATAVVAVCTAMVVPAAAQASPQARHVLAHSAPDWAAGARSAAKVPGSRSVSVRVYLAPNGGTAGLKAAAAALSDPASSSYRQFLSAAAYHAAYDPTAASVASVSAWLSGSGLSVTTVQAHHQYIDAVGSAAAVQAAFAVTLADFTHLGQAVQAPVNDASVPAAIADQVQAVGGLDTTQHYAKTEAVPPVFRNGRPCSAWYGQLTATYQADYQTPLPPFEGTTLPYAICGYVGSQFRSAYEGTSSLTGAGVTVGVIDAYASPTIVGDSAEYATNNGDQAWAPGQYTQTLPAAFTKAGLCGPTGWYGEQTLDIEAVHAMAGGAALHYYAGASCENADLLAAAQQAVDDDAVQLVSNSYGDLDSNADPAYIVASEQVFLQGALEGISFLFSSGDDGDELAASGLSQTDYQASDPYVTAVGGTATAINRKGKLAWQTGWGTDKYLLSTDAQSWDPVGFVYGSGGGYSGLFNRPDYQEGVVPATAPAGRAVPDVAMDADPTTGMLIGETQKFPDGSRAYSEYRIGGTSLASPLFAGMTALTIEASNGGAPVGTGTSAAGLGLLNPLIYANAATGVFTDVKGAPRDLGNVRVDYVNGVDPTNGLQYSVRTFDQDSTLNLARGWDDVTGVGSPNAGWLTVVPPIG